ncbi:MAG: isoprenylcysteine carboxylmethyltransferase family protein [Vicinamibacteria bacterium]
MQEPVPTSAPPDRRALAWRSLVQFGVFMLAAALMLFGLAGRLDWRGGWAFLGLLTLVLGINLPVLLRHNPEIVLERGRTRILRKDTKAFDRVFIAIYLPAAVSVLVVAALDAGRDPARELPFAALAAGVALQLLGDVPILGAMVVNRHLEPTVRIQSDRGHRVITGGPYRYVRHPMYVGMLAMYAAWPLVLGSRWAFLPAGIVAAMLLVRTALEDATLQAELPGYAEYAGRTRFRLLPGVW